MNLIAYSDSEDSADETLPVPTPVAKPAQKPAFQKVVDRSNPGRIKLNLPGPSRPQAEKDDLDAEGPPAKKVRTGGGALGGLNAMLPAPKKPQGDAISAKRGAGKGLAAGVNLRTGAEPAFKREPRIDMEEYDENGNVVKKEPMKKEDFRAMLNLPAPKSEKPAESKTVVQKEVIVEHVPEVKPVARPRFMPLSVASRGKKKKPVARPAVTASKVAEPSSTADSLQGLSAEPKPLARPKVSLFSMSQDVEAPAKTQSHGDYQPLLYGATDEHDAPISDDAAFDRQPHSSTTNPQIPAAPSGLTNIASELNLSASERRQLFGRTGQNPDMSSAKFVEFNTDSEYAHNEMLRQRGETVQHNALKSISGTGKNSLKSLINVATTQKDALEDHFAQGRRNKREVGNKYGW
jgi:hypothetical protein